MCYLLAFALARDMSPFFPACQAKQKGAGCRSCSLLIQLLATIVVALAGPQIPAFYDLRDIRLLFAGTVVKNKCGTGWHFLGQVFCHSF
jgi:hypothetical protein